MKQRRFGKFHLHAELVVAAHPAVTRIMGACSILRAEHNLMSNAVEYQAVSFKFRHIEPGEVIPEYTWTLGQDGSLECKEVTDVSRGWMSLREAHSRLGPEA